MILSNYLACDEVPTLVSLPVASDSSKAQIHLVGISTYLLLAE